MAGATEKLRAGGKSSQARSSDASLNTVHADILKFFPELVTELGGNTAQLLEPFGKTPAAISNRDNPVSYRLWIDLLEHAAKELECTDFGLRLAARQSGANVTSPITAILKNSSTLGEVLTFTKTHTYAHSLAVRIRHKLAPDQSLFVGYDILLDRLPNRRQGIEQIQLSGYHAVVEATGGQARVRRVHFRHQPLSPLSSYRKYFGCEVRFNQPMDGVVYSKRDLLCPIVGANTKAYQAAASLIDTSFEHVVPPLHAQVRGVIGQFLNTPHCHNVRVAAELGFHPRTLHRRLREEGKAFLEIKEEVRRDAALYFLQQTDLDLTRIAERLGYAEHSVFTRSCVRWFSMAPSLMRASNGRVQQKSHRAGSESP